MGWFWVDFIASIPLDTLSVLFGDDQLCIAKICKFIQMLKICKVFRMLKMLRVRDVVDETIDLGWLTPGTSKMLSIVFIYFLAMHFIGCAFWGVARETGAVSLVTVPDLDEPFCPLAPEEWLLDAERAAALLDELPALLAAAAAQRTGTSGVPPHILERAQQAWRQQQGGGATPLPRFAPPQPIYKDGGATSDGAELIPQVTHSGDARAAQAQRDRVRGAGPVAAAPAADALSLIHI